MLYVLLAAWLGWPESLWFGQISRNNQARQEAQLAYQAGQYNRALTLYAYLSRTTTSIDPAVRLNLGHTYFQLKQYKKAKSQYETLLQSDRPDLRTAAATQLGVMVCLEGDSATALSLFRQALLESADNEAARYNFELIKKNYSGKPPATAPRRQSAVRKPKVVSKPRPSGGQQVERSARQDELLRRFRDLNLSQDQALQLLNALQADDLPYALTRLTRQSAKPVPGGNRW